MAWFKVGLELFRDAKLGQKLVLSWIQLVFWGNSYSWKRHIGQRSLVDLGFELFRYEKWGLMGQKDLLSWIKLVYLGYLCSWKEIMKQVLNCSDIKNESIWAKNNYSYGNSQLILGTVTVEMRKWGRRAFCNDYN